MTAPRAISQTDIVNKAQILLGQSKRFTDLESSNEQAAINFQTLWPIALRSALALHPWNFAVSRAQISPDTVAPPFGWAYRYKLPADCIRVLPWSRDAWEWFEGEVEGGYMLTNQGEAIRIRYIRLIDNPSSWSPLFTDVLAHQLALEHCEAGTGKRGLSQDIASRLDALIADARRADALENGNRKAMRPIVASNWAAARYRPRGW